MTTKKKKKEVRCGMVSIVGRPNVGKSTLLNTIVEEKVAIVSKVPQTTRNSIRGIYSDERGQIVFIDTPGLHAVRDRLDKFMTQTAYGATQETDCIIHLVDANDEVGREEEFLVERLAGLKTKVILGINKVDLKGKCADQYISLWEKVCGRPVTEIENLTILPLSGKTGKNVDKLIEVVFEALPFGEPLYPEGTVCDVPQKMALADIIREKMINILRQELPHSIAVVIEEIIPKRRGVMYIRSVIVVEKETQKMIVIGKDGRYLKKIGLSARKEMEYLLDKKVFLEIFVKARKHWRDDSNLLEEMGYLSG